MNHMHPCRQRRLSRGWEPAHLAVRMKHAAARDGLSVPKVYVLMRWLFLWENHRSPLPGLYAGLIADVLNVPAQELTGHTSG